MRATHASLMHEINITELDPIKIDGKIVIEEPEIFRIKGILSYQSETMEGVQVRHQLYPSTEQPVFIDMVKIINPTNKMVNLEIPKTLDGVKDNAVLNPRGTWEDKDKYDEMLAKLAGMFQENFRRYDDNGSEFNYASAGPQL